MDTEKTERETIESFRKSFFYGSRTDLNFKFLATLSDEKVGGFFQNLFHIISNAYDTDNSEDLFDFVVTAQEESYSKEVKFTYEDGPFTPMEKPVSESNIVLLTSSGHYAKGDDPKPLGVASMTQQEAIKRIMEFIKEAPILSAIPKNTPAEDLMVCHGGYDISGAKTDPNVAFPLDLFRKLEQKKIIGKLADTAFSFVGACSQMRLIKKTGPKWVTKLKNMNIDAVFMVPV
jgi:D-proline reductase (dithiol) PrdB